MTAADMLLEVLASRRKVRTHHFVSLVRVVIGLEPGDFRNDVKARRK